MKWSPSSQQSMMVSPIFLEVRGPLAQYVISPTFDRDTGSRIIHLYLNLDMLTDTWSHV